MALALPAPIRRLVSLLASLPGIGPRMAQRLVLNLLKGDPKRVWNLSEALEALGEKVKTCDVCGFLIDAEEGCSACQDASRDPSLLCVVGESEDALVIENTGQYSGHYHVLGGLLSPMEGIGPAQIRVRQLLDRLRDGQVQEVIVATSPNMEGDATALYLKETIQPLGIRVTRLARGVPSGGDLRYTDAGTLGAALEGRETF